MNVATYSLRSTPQKLIHQLVAGTSAIKRTTLSALSQNARKC
ncbi:MAG TPA: hypothetical protein PLE40_00575 [Candidatus Pacearchaeota archaeon]|nr:hypothetical protein [Candidatus Pacearchaeota archaeon]HPO68231.1 hypothetical protein [Candidatus Pacearchaeota archaeon]